MAANLLNSPQAVRRSVFVVRAFLKRRQLLGGTKALVGVPDSPPPGKTMFPSGTL